jgi:hypothetical protein
VVNPKIGWDAPPWIPSQNKTVYLAPATSDHHRQTLLGYHHHTLFYVPLCPIWGDRSSKDAVSDMIRDAFTSAGYDVRPVNEAATGAFIVRPNVQHCTCRSWSWFWPFMSNSSAVSVTLMTEGGTNDAPQRQVFKEQADWATFISSWGFESRIRQNFSSVAWQICSKFNADAPPFALYDRRVYEQVGLKFPDSSVTPETRRDMLVAAMKREIEIANEWRDSQNVIGSAPSTGRKLSDKTLNELEAKTSRLRLVAFLHELEAWKGRPQ